MDRANTRWLDSLVTDSTEAAARSASLRSLAPRDEVKRDVVVKKVLTFKAPTTDKTCFGYLIWNERQKRRLSLDAAKVEHGISGPTISGLETGKRQQPTLENFVALCRWAKIPFKDGFVALGLLDRDTLKVIKKKATKR